MKKMKFLTHSSIMHHLKSSLQEKSH